MSISINQLNLIIKIFGKIVDHFEPNELAYLAITSKVEHVLRDKLAYLLETYLDDQIYVISREWKRVDLAILKDNKPEVLIECKAMYTFDAVDKKRNKLEYKTEIQNDQRKLNSIFPLCPQKISILFAVHPKEKFENINTTNVVKYKNQINSCINKHKNPEEIFNICDNEVSSWFKVVDKGRLNCGQYRNHNIEIGYWLFSI